MSAASLNESEDYVEEYTSEHSDIFVSSLEDEFQNTIALLDLEVDEVDDAVLNSLEEVHIGLYIFSSTYFRQPKPFDFKTGKPFKILIFIF